MAFLSSTLELPRSEVPRARRSVWRRMFEAVIAARRREIDREIALYLRDSGRAFTDDTERRIETRFLSCSR